MSDDMKILGKDGKPVQAEGIKAKFTKEARENVSKILSLIDDDHQMIFIVTDLTGRTPTHVHIQGPSKDKVLLYGMLELARDCAGMACTPSE